MCAIVVGSSKSIRSCFLGRWHCRLQPLVCCVSPQRPGRPDHRFATAKYSLRRKSHTISLALCWQASFCFDVVAFSGQTDHHGLQATPEKDAPVVRKVSLEDLAAVVELLAVSAAWSLSELEASMCIAMLSALSR
ncbi:TPA: hypothetical protein ACH3X2_14294 [Trebouxia sp. C0005]